MTHGTRKFIVDSIGKLYPDALSQTSIVPSDSTPLPEGRLSADQYYKSLQQCKIVLSLPGKGYDTFRFWENSACNAIHISSRMPLYVPNDFIEKEHIFKFNDIEELKRNIDKILSGKFNAEEIILKNRDHLAIHHFTDKRAVYFLDKIKKAFAK